MITPLPRILIEPTIRAALLEDLGRAGDITSDSVIPQTTQTRVAFIARDPGTIAGLDCAAIAFSLLDPTLTLKILFPDGSRIAPGDTIATIAGNARAILSAERVALNFLGHLSGIATATHSIARTIAHTNARITCTRKTAPNLRALQKYAVRCGGGANHRFGLDDAILIKDNHIAIAGGITTAITRARASAGHLVKIECEVDTLDQLTQALAAGADAILLDNFDIPTLRQAVTLINGTAIAEASGRITPHTAAGIAETGVNLISAGWLTHSTSVLDIGLDFMT
ncbi:MAG: carboxylating nicotinate-nucleotide diphosphorylase [Acidiphilium sp.]|nr:carboxylating nicotinate-nucleotide diphosphorylase [Acidiphilium sp.]MDD4934893.1 carboxylating nicotinate-nucleotide diphosphorylase [Acidiphilium sp.]